MGLARKFLPITLLVISASAFAQLQGLEKLMSPNWAAPEIAQYNPGLSIFFEIENAQAPYMNGIAQHLIKTKKGLYLMPDGTGRVYKVERNGKGLKIVRQDSSLYFGYNFGFFPFSYRDTLYSLGGYGYWKFNGHLRTFVSQKGEWELENLNREIPFTRVAYTATPKWVDQQKGRLWISGAIDSREGLKQQGNELKRVIDTVYVLDIYKKTWTTLGRLAPFVKEIASGLTNRNLGSSPWGQLIHDAANSKIYLLDFSNNELLSLNPQETRSITILFEKASIHFFKDSTLYLGLQSRPLDSINLSRLKFKKTGNQVYHSKKEIPQSISSFTSNSLTWIIASIVIGGIGLLVYVRMRKPKVSSRPTEHHNSVSNLFDDKEIDTIKLVLLKSKKGLGTSIEDINRSLGVSQKNIEVQKKQRSETLIAINRKWRFKNGNQEILIKKRRTEQDKRSFEYFIDFESIRAIEQLI